MTETNPATPSHECTSEVGIGRKGNLWIAVLSVVLPQALIVGDVSVAGSAIRGDWFAQHRPGAIEIPAAILIATIVASGAFALDVEAAFAFFAAMVTGGDALVLLWLPVFAGVVLAIRTLW